MHKSNAGFDFWDNEKEQVLNLYINKELSANEISKIYGCNGTTILRQLKRWNIKTRKRSNAKYKVDNNFFSNIDNEEKAYWLGLLFADGHVSKDGVLMLCMKDLDIIEKFKKSLKSEHPIKYDKYNNPYINIRCKQICEDLRKIGFNNRKSYEVDFNKILSYVPNNLLHHFVRGMFDGDGSIKVYRYEYLNKPQYHFGYTGLKEVCEFIQDFLNFNNKIIKEGEVTYTCKTRNLNKIKEIYYKLYEDAHIYLNRKYETFKKEIL